MNKSDSILYPLLVGLMLGVFQTGLFFQLTFAFTSGFTTYLLITLCWLIGGVIGAVYSSRRVVWLQLPLILTLICYGLCSVIVNAFPFNTQLWLIYALLIGCAGIYPGAFFVKVSAVYTAQRLFLWENNGFISGIIMTGLLFMFVGRTLLWFAPVFLTIVVYMCQIQRVFGRVDRL